MEQLFVSDSEIALKFTNKTDSGLTITAVSELETDGDDISTMDESSLSISGDFGKIVLGRNNSVGDNFGIEAEDLITEESTPNGSGANVSTDTDVIPASGDDNKVSYFLPAMSGFKAGI
tara:strand:+ start:496 stop:852 length:357 start_codon:yes stop_codon:yes gene_type:complete